jgi:outer membrane protein TolC
VLSDRDGDDLFPSINLIAGYEVQGEDYGLENSSDVVSAGVAFKFPFGNQVEKAEHEVSKVLADKSKLETQNTWYRLYAQLTGLYLQIEREEKLIRIADEKIGLARAILKDETENYSFGKVTLNDYIQAVNVLDSNRFNKVRHESLNRKFLIEWLRLMDQLVSRKEIQGLSLRDVSP